MPVDAGRLGDDEELTTTQAAQLMDVSVSTLNRWLTLYEVKPVKVYGQSKLYRRADIEALRKERIRTRATGQPHEGKNHHPR